MNYFDLHCDTPFEIYHKNMRFSDGNTHITAKKTAALENYVQVFDVWSDNKLSDNDAFSDFFKIYENFKNELSASSEFAFCTCADDMKNALENNKKAALLGVEGANLLAGDINRLYELFKSGVRILTLTWAGESCIGGAHGTKTGLTDFGREVVLKCESLGIITDVSHGSDKLTEETVEICSSYRVPAIATHSNSRECRDHSRNLTDTQAKKIAAAGGIIGISLCDNHLKARGEATIDDVIRHMAHYLDLGLENNVCFGSDFDGTDLPLGINGIEDVYKIHDAAHEYGIDDNTLEKVFFKNAEKFFLKFL